jgi:hypothetical protein
MVVYASLPPATSIASSVSLTSGPMLSLGQRKNVPMIGNNCLCQKAYTTKRSYASWASIELHMRLHVLSA